MIIHIKSLKDRKTFDIEVTPQSTADDIKDDTDMKQCADFFKKLFLAKNKNPEKSVFTHITTAVDTSNVKFVFNAVVAIILEENLKASGLA